MNLSKRIMKQMRSFPYITVGKILAELEKVGFTLTRVTFYRLEKRLGFPTGKRTHGKVQWRIYTREQADAVKEAIRKEYNFS